jgi:hypothetical protein
VNTRTVAHGNWTARARTFLLHPVSVCLRWPADKEGRCECVEQTGQTADKVWSCCLGRDKQRIVNRNRVLEIVAQGLALVSAVMDILAPFLG